MGQLQGMKWDFMGGYLLIESGTIVSPSSFYFRVLAIVAKFEETC
jgi:hypothetical protein